MDVFVNTVVGLAEGDARAAASDGTGVNGALQVATHETVDRFVE